MILNFKNEVKVFENQNKWDEVIELLSLEWEKDKTDLNNFLCLGTELWYILGCQTMKNTNLIDKLIDITKYGFENFQNETYFNAIFGYMISLFPYYFLDCGNYYEQVNEGEKMIEKAYMQEKANDFLAAIYFNTIGEVDKYKKACLSFTQNKEKYFSEDQAVGNYFIRILSH